MINNQIKIAIQKSGRIQKDSMDYLKKMGISFTLQERQMSATDLSNQFKILTLRSNDIVKKLENGKIDVGIFGKDTWLESNKSFLKYKNLNFSKCRMSIAVPQDTVYQDMSDLEGKIIATSFRNILQKKLDKKNIKAEIYDMDGSVEMAPDEGWADAIFDIVGTGQTLLANNLVEKETLFNSNAIIVTRNDFVVPDNAILQNMLLSKKEIAGKKVRENLEYNDYRYSDCRIYS